MSKIKDLLILIQEDIAMEVLSFAEIARKHEVPLSWVREAWTLLCEQEQEQESAHYPDPDNWYEEQYDLGDY